MSELREPSAVTRRRVELQTESYSPGAHHSLSPGFRYLPFPATGREEVPYFAAYLTQMSVVQGEKLSAHVATRSDQLCNVDIYRVIGCEDASLRPKLSFVRRLGPIRPHRLPPSGEGRRLSSGDADAEGCRWPKVELLSSIPGDWPSGVYMAQFSAEDAPRGHTSSRAGEDALFIVRRGANRQGPRILCQVNVATWAAYHIWHNRSLYTGRAEDGKGLGELRASRVSLHRPGTGLCLPNETMLGPYPPKAAHIFAFIDWLEREDILVDYCSGLDVSSGYPDVGTYDALLTVGHDEYWTVAQLDAVRDFRLAGGHTVFLGGNLGGGTVRETPDGTALECYKYSADTSDNEEIDGVEYLEGESLDPLAEAASPKAHPHLTGYTWRLRDESTIPTTGVYNAVRRPEPPNEMLIGGGMWWWEIYGGPSRPRSGFTICDPDHWVFEGLNLQKGDTIGAEIKLVGHEADGLEVEFGSDGPQLSFRDGALPGTQLLAIADCRPWGEWDFSGWPPVFTPKQQRTFGSMGGVATMIHRETPGEGMLFCAPTTDWVFGLVPSIDWTATRSLEPPIFPADPAVEQITRNVLVACQRRAPAVANNG